jgi:hypothetical protein
MEESEGTTMIPRVEADETKKLCFGLSIRTIVYHNEFKVA